MFVYHRIETAFSLCYVILYKLFKRQRQLIAKNSNIKKTTDIRQKTPVFTQNKFYTLYIILDKYSIKCRYPASL